MKIRLTILLLIGLAIRLVLMPISLHPDLWAVIISGKLFAYDGIINIYDYLSGISLSDNPLTINYGANFFTYPPLAYYTFGFHSLILKPFVNNDFITNIATNLPNIISDNRLYWHLFIAKVPYLFYDFGSLFFLRKIFTSKKEKLIATIIWLFNPVIIYSTYLIGQFEIIPVFFTIISLYFAKKDKAYLSAFAMGIGGAYKMYPLFFIPLIIVLIGKNVRHKLILGTVGMLPYFLTSLPFIGSLAFRSFVLLSNQSQKILFAKIPVSGAEYLSVFIVGYVALMLFSALVRKSLWIYCMAVLLLMFSVTHYHPQWLIWLSPFLVICAVFYKNTRWLLIGLLICWLFITLMFEPSLSFGLFTPLTRVAYTGILLTKIVGQYSDPFMLLSIVRSIFAGLSLGLTVFLLKSDNQNV